MIRKQLGVSTGIAVALTILACTFNFAAAQEPGKAPAPQPVEDRSSSKREIPYPPVSRPSPFYLPGYANSPASLDPYSGYGIPPHKVPTQPNSSKSKKSDNNPYSRWLPYFLPTYGFNPLFAYGYSRLMQQDSSDDDSSSDANYNGASSMSTQRKGDEKNKKEQQELVGGKTATSTILLALGLRSDDRGELQWPLGLRILAPAAETQELREQIDSLMRVATAQAMRGQVSPSIIQDAKETVRKFRALLDERGDVMANETREQARGYLKKLDRALSSLQ